MSVIQDSINDVTDVVQDWVNGVKVGILDDETIPDSDWRMYRAAGWALVVTYLALYVGYFILAADFASRTIPT